MYSYGVKFFDYILLEQKIFLASTEAQVLNIKTHYLNRPLK